MQISANGVALEVEDHGPAGGEPLVLIMGLGMQLVAWPADFVASISLSYLADMQLELIAPVSGENIYSDFLRDCGPGLHHVCMEAESPEQFHALLAQAADHGAPVVQQGVMPGGIQFAYVSAPQAGVPFVEFAYVSPEMRAFYDYIKQEQR